MSWLQLDPDSIVQRVTNSTETAVVPSFKTFIARGIIGFTLVSIAGFAPWALPHVWLGNRLGETGLYAMCAAAFIGTSGLLLHRLIIGPESLSRFYKLFGTAFAGYSIAWIVGWMSLRGHPGSIAGLLAGTVVMGVILTRAFEVKRGAGKIIILLFLLNSAGYFLGGILMEWLAAKPQISLFGSVLAKPVQMTAAKLLWGICYGVGFGAGLGWAFHSCQAQALAMLSTSGKTPAQK